MTRTLKFQPPGKPRKEWPKKSLGPGLLTPSAAARKLDLHLLTMRRLVDSGDVKTVIFAGYCYVPLSEVERLQRLFSGEVSE